MSLKVFLLLLLGLVLFTTSTLAGYDHGHGYHHPPQGGYRPPKHGPHSSEDTLSDENIPLDGRDHYKRPPYKKHPPVVETEGKGEGYDRPKIPPKQEPIYGDPRKGDGPKKPPHKPPLEN